MRAVSARAVNNWPNMDQYLVQLVNFYLLWETSHGELKSVVKF